MVTLSSISRTRKPLPDAVLLVGSEGVGKSTFGANAPDSVFIPVETGIDHLPVPAFPKPQTLAEFKEALEALLGETHKYKTLVVDTVDALENLICADTLKANSWPNMEALGFAKCWVPNLDEWRRILNLLDRLRTEKGMEVILIAHAQVKTFRNPTGADYDTYAPKLEKRATALLREWANAVLFATFDETVVNGKKEAGLGEKGKVVVTGQRIIRTERRNGWEAKNRHNLPETLALSYEDYAVAREKGRPASSEQMYAEAQTLLAKVDEGTRSKAAPVIEASKNDPVKMAQHINRLRVIAEGKE